MDQLFIAVDSGGTHTRVGSGVAPESAQIATIYDTPAQFDAAFSQLCDHISQLITSAELLGISVGIPGQADAAGQISRVAHLPGWDGQPLGQLLAEKFHVPVIVTNDTALMAVGEAVYGAGHDYEIVTYLSVGTGVGGARIVRGQVDANRLGFEPGHMRATASNPPFEHFIAGAGITARTGLPPSQVQDQNIWEQSSANLATLIYNSCLLWSPDVVVLGGGLIERDQIPLASIHSYLNQIDSIFPKLPPVVKGTLGERAGIVGGIHLHQQK